MVSARGVQKRKLFMTWEIQDLFRHYQNIQRMLPFCHNYFQEYYHYFLQKITHFIIFMLNMNCMFRLISQQ